MFTVANLLCGYYAILATLEGQPADFDNAARAIGIAIVFDSLDGRVARAMGTNSEFGKQFDSLADIVSFGMAPAFLAYAWGVHTLGLASESAPHLIPLGWLIGFFYVGCCAWRLARFNIQGMAPGGNRFFAGMPTPAAAGMVAAVVHAFPSPVQDGRISIMWLGLIVALGLLMSSTVRYYSFKDIPWTRRQPSLAILLLVLLIGGVVLFLPDHAPCDRQRVPRPWHRVLHRALGAPSLGFPPRLTYARRAAEFLQGCYRRRIFAAR